ncbi:aminopeptidase N [Flavobacterium flevense]|uniref:Aminopeptidase N n=1 Tax=Flavobacterium flevense TaxID=983 RepID=A0A4Y4B2K0_9FLAO|nr:M1 family metallopeptidase [Flavobacterium flevense]GEC73347.1 aminopeptidase [Flavobacterium flevense]SHM07121.1 aminopeptidase N [Flavobacterium flevense]
MKYFFLFVSSFIFAQQTKFVDFTSVSAHLKLNPAENSISGTVNYSFKVLEPTDTIKIDAQNMQFSSVKLNKEHIHHVNSGKQLLLIYPFQKGENQISFEYNAIPKQALYFIHSQNPEDLQIWTQGQGKYTSNWFPSFDDVNEKVIFNLQVEFDSDFQVISNGILEQKKILGTTTLWQYQMQKPMSSYLLMLAIGKFEKQTQFSKSGIPLEMYLENRDKSRFEPTYRYSARIFDFLEKEIGIKYPWQIYKQVPVRDFLYAGMENTSATLFASRYVVDSTGFLDRNYTNVDAHELAHQWFGDLVTAASGKHHWLQEGFATYYALLAEKAIYGEDYFYSKMYESIQQIKYASRTDTIPVLNEKASSLTYYQKGAWALFALHQEIGDKAFRKVIKNYLKKYAFKTVTTDDFLAEVKKVSRFDTELFSKEWLESTVINTQNINKLLVKNKITKILLELDKIKSKPLAQKEGFFKLILMSDAHYSAKVMVVNQLKNESFEAKKPFLELVMNTKNLPVRQAVAYSLPKIPEEFRTDYESLLDDASYQTQEIALLYLWRNFPEKRFEYLEKSKSWIGFNDYNLRTLWLSLALLTTDYVSDKTVLIDELIDYSSEKYEATTRQNALEKLIGFKIINQTVLINLVKATTHHMWQFSKFGRDTIRTLLKNQVYRDSFAQIITNLNEKEQFQLNRLLNEKI